MTKAIYFDMDGTIADLYAVEGWRPMLEAHNATLYTQAKGIVIGVISWLAEDTNEQYDTEVTNAKRKWLATHLKSVQWDEVHIVPYGTPKHNIVSYPNGILFDDEVQNRNMWTGTAYDVQDIVGIVKALLCE